jgi:hypothetical protein
VIEPAAEHRARWRNLYTDQHLTLRLALPRPVVVLEYFAALDFHLHDLCSTVHAPPLALRQASCKDWRYVMEGLY